MYLNGFLFFYIVQEKLRAHFITLFSKYHIYHFFLHTYSFSFYLSPPSTQNGADVYNFLKTRWENIHLFLFVFKTVHKQLSKLNQFLNRNWQLNSRKSFTGQFLILRKKNTKRNEQSLSFTFFFRRWKGGGEGWAKLKRLIYKESAEIHEQCPMAFFLPYNCPELDHQLNSRICQF